MAVPSRVIHKRREAITALPLYYSGYLLKKSSREKNFKDFYGELRGSTLFLYDNDTQETYIERLDLEQMRSMDSNTSYKKREPTILTLNMPSEMVQLKMDSADTGEEWRGYIMTVAKKEIPQRLQLLPGQMINLEEVLELESKRNPQLLRPPLPPRPNELKPKNTTMPNCFFDVSRQEAMKMLEDNPENGSIILRPSTQPKNYALTLRQKTSSGATLKNYRVTASNFGFVIELDTPVTVPSLDDVLKYFLEKTEYRLCPYVISQPYDTRIFTSPPPKCISISSPSLQATPRAQVAPILRSDILRPEKPDEGEYIVPDDRKPYDHTLKNAELESELQAIFKRRRENIYVTNGEEKTHSYENQSPQKSEASWSASNT